METFTALTNKELNQLAVAINKMRLPNNAPPVVLKSGHFEEVESVAIVVVMAGTP